MMTGAIAALGCRPFLRWPALHSSSVSTAKDTAEAEKTKRLEGERKNTVVRKIAAIHFCITERLKATKER